MSGGGGALLQGKPGLDRLVAGLLPRRALALNLFVGTPLEVTGVIELSWAEEALFPLLLLQSAAVALRVIDNCRIVSDRRTRTAKYWPAANEDGQNGENLRGGEKTEGGTCLGAARKAAKLHTLSDAVLQSSLVSCTTGHVVVLYDDESSINAPPKSFL